MKGGMHNMVNRFSNARSLKYFASGLCAMLLALPASAMEAPPPHNDDPVDEVTVIGQRTILALRLQMEAAQEEVHLLYNELNTNDAYDIICKTTDRYYSKIKDKQCKPQFAWDARAQEGQDFARQIKGEGFVQGAPSNYQIALQEPGLREQFIEALRNSPELFDAIVKHAQLMEQLQQAQSTYFGDER